MGRNGWHAEQMLALRVSLVEPTVKLLPHAQATFAFGKYVGWVSDFIAQAV
jgi:hypothetical protein